MNAKTEATFERITNAVIAALEQGLANPKGWRPPWTRLGLFPHNAESRRAYRGSNAFYLACVQAVRGYETPHWCTYNGWKRLGAQVQKRPADLGKDDEWGTAVILWKPVQGKEQDDGEKGKGFLLARTYTVFNAAQVDGWEPPDVTLPDPIETVEHCEAFYKATGLHIAHGGDSAYYTAAADRIQMPAVRQFKTAEGYYATLGHEATHATGHKTRCDRDLSGRFGSHQYAAEELVAEMGAAFLGAHLGIEVEPRVDHFHYIANWLQALRADVKAIQTAASLAQRAADWLIDAAGEGHKQADDEQEDAA